MCKEKKNEADIYLFVLLPCLCTYVVDDKSLAFLVVVVGVTAAVAAATSRLTT